MSTDTARRPTPLLPTGRQAPDGRDFPWGPVDAIHEIGEYQIVEYRRDTSNTWPQSAWVEHGQTQFSLYINGRSAGRSYRSLDEALVGAVGYKHEGPNGRAAEYFAAMVGLSASVSSAPR